MARYRIRDVARDEDNNAVVGGAASLRRESDNVEIASTTTGADGSFGWLESEVKYPGPVKTLVTAPDGVVRQQSGKNTGQVGTFFMSDLMRAFAMMTDGVVSGVDGGLAVSASGGSMDVTVGTGLAFVAGHPSYWAANSTVTPAANGTGNPRIDLVAIRVNMPGTAEEGKQVITLVQGTPAASPVAPGVTQDPNTVWELALGHVTVPAGAATISSGNITDVRTYSSGPLMDGSVTTAKIANLAITAAKIAEKTITAAKLTAEAVVSAAGTARVLKAPTVSTDAPAYSQLSIRELSDVQDIAATDGQVPTWDATDGRWEPRTPSTGGIRIKNNDVTVSATATAMDLSSNFLVVESPAGEVNVSIAPNAIDTGKIIDGSVTNAKIIGAVDATKIGNGSVDNAEFSYLNGVTSAIQTQLDGKAASSHTHSATQIASGSVGDTEFMTLADISTAQTIQTQLNGKASTAHTHSTNPALMNNATKAYGFTSVSSTSGATVASCSITLLSGVTYDIHATGFGVLNAPSGGSITLGVKIGSQSTDWGTEVQVVGADKAAYASSFRILTGGSTQTIALQCKVSGSSGSITTGHVTVFAVPRS